MIQKEEIRRIQKLFEEIDVNGDGLLSFDEIDIIMKKNGTPKKTKLIFKILDKNNSHMVSYEEFIKAMVNKNKISRKKNLKGLFDALDTDKNGTISINELRDISNICGDSTKDMNFRKFFMEYSKGRNAVGLTSSPFRGFRL